MEHPQYKPLTAEEDIRHVWSKLFDFAQASVNFDGIIDFDGFFKYGSELFDVKLKNEE